MPKDKYPEHSAGPNWPVERIGLLLEKAVERLYTGDLPTDFAMSRSHGWIVLPEAAPTMNIHVGIQAWVIRPGHSLEHLPIPAWILVLSGRNGWTTLNSAGWKWFREKVAPIVRPAGEMQQIPVIELGLRSESDAGQDYAIDNLLLTADLKGFKHSPGYVFCPLCGATGRQIDLSGVSMTCGRCGEKSFTSCWKMAFPTRREFERLHRDEMREQEKAGHGRRAVGNGGGIAEALWSAIKNERDPIRRTVGGVDEMEMTERMMFAAMKADEDGVLNGREAGADGDLVLIDGHAEYQKAYRALTTAIGVPDTASFADMTAAVHDLRAQRDRLERDSAVVTRMLAERGAEATRLAVQVCELLETNERLLAEVDRLKPDDPEPVVRRRPRPPVCFKMPDDMNHADRRTFAAVDDPTRHLNHDDDID